MSSKLPTFDFSEAPEIELSDLKLFVGNTGTGKLINYRLPTGDVTLSAVLEAARLALTTATFKEFGALKENIKIERKAGATKTNYKDSKANEANFSLINCTEANYNMADELDGERIDLVELDEANAKMKIFENLKISTTETDENEKHPEIGFKLANDTFSQLSRRIIDLMTGTK